MEEMASLLVKQQRTAKQELERQIRAKRWLIDPRTSRIASVWDAVTVIAMCFVAIATPFEVAFMKAPESAAERRDSLGGICSAAICSASPPVGRVARRCDEAAVIRAEEATEKGEGAAEQRGIRLRCGAPVLIY